MSSRAGASGGEPRGGPRSPKAKDGKHQGMGRSSGRYDVGVKWYLVM